MKRTIAQLFELLLLTLSGLAGSIIVGLLVYGGNVFDVNSPGFMFLSYGLSGAFIFSFYRVRGLSNTITAAVVVSTIQFVLMSSWITMLRAVIFSFGINLPVIALAFIFERKLAPLKQAKFIAVAVTYGAMFVLLTLLVRVISGSVVLPPEIFRENFTDGFLLGLGLGVGIEGGEVFVHSLEQQAVRSPMPPEKHA